MIQPARTIRFPLVLALILGTSACASTGGGGAAKPAPSGSGTNPGGTVTSTAPAQGTLRWSVGTAEHVDSWLHAFALISTDTTRVPLYRRGYRDSLMTVRSRANVLTALDGNRAALAARLAESPAYLQAQFFPFEFGSWEELRGAAEQFLQFQGNPGRAPDQNTANRIALFASVFTTAADREWLRLFLASAIDERARFFAAEHARARTERAATVAAVSALWQDSYRARFERFLTNTSQRNGELLLSLPLGGEGRTTSSSGRGALVAVTWPARADDAREAILVMAHEITGSLVGGVVSDNTTPAEKREGVSDRYVSAGQVRAGAMLLEKVAPELVEPYTRYYLQQAGSTERGTAAFGRVFALPQGIVDGLMRQIEIVLGGI